MFLKKSGDTELGTRAELKNINSFKFIEKAINFEIDRQIRVIESGKSVVQETRLYDSEKNETRSMRSKEEANDYRYFPCPDLLPVVISDEELLEIKENLPELPEEKEIGTFKKLVLKSLRPKLSPLLKLWQTCLKKLHQKQMMQN